MSFEQTFDNAVHDYEQARPGYPDGLYRDLLRRMPLDAHSRALEIGIGTGKASAPVLATGCHLTGIEPGERLAALAEEKYGRLPNFSLHVQTLQEYECPAGTFELIYAATAFHWIDPDYGYPRVLELLKPGGVFARFAYHAARDSSRPGLAAAVQSVYDRYMPRTKPAREFGEEDAAALARLAAGYGFADTEYRLYRFRKDFSADEYMRLLSTYPDHMKLPTADRDALFRGIYDAVNRHGGIITVNYIVDLELAVKP